jgi:hypothetical protein
MLNMGNSACTTFKMFSSMHTIFRILQTERYLGSSLSQISTYYCYALDNGHGFSILRIKQKIVCDHRTLLSGYAFSHIVISLKLEYVSQCVLSHNVVREEVYFFLNDTQYFHVCCTRSN